LISNIFKYGQKDGSIMVLICLVHLQSQLNITPRCLWVFTVWISVLLKSTGLTSYASLDSIYCETGWENLTVRREDKKLNLFYKIINNEAPEYLSELIPPGWKFSNI
jgi:hypothetical protein